MFEFEFDGSEDDSKKLIKLVGEGKAYFIVTSAENCISKAGNQQLKVALRVTDDYGTTNVIFVYFPAIAAFKKKLIGFLSACGKSELYQSSGRFDEQDLIGCSGACNIVHKDNGSYGMKAEVKFFYEKNEKSAPHHVNQAKANGFVASELDDDLGDLPF